MAAAAEHALADGDAVGRDLPLLRRGGDQHGASGGTDLAHFFVAAGNGIAAAGALHAKARVGIAGGVGRSRLDDDLGPVGVQLFGHQGGDTGEHALADFCIAADDRDQAVIADAQEVARRELRAGGDELVIGAGGDQRTGHDGQREAGAGLEQGATAGVSRSVTVKGAET